MNDAVAFEAGHFTPCLLVHVYSIVSDLCWRTHSNRFQREFCKSLVGGADVAPISAPGAIDQAARLAATL